MSDLKNIIFYFTICDLQVVIFDLRLAPWNLKFETLDLKIK